MISGRISRAIDTFLDSLNKNTLQRGSCFKCAVGSLVREGMLKDPNCEIVDDIKVKVGNIDNAEWMYLFITTPYGRDIRGAEDFEIENGLKAISYTEFTEEELSQIEYIFEKTADNSSREGMIKGLNAVISLMLTFDENKEDKVEEIFTKHANLIPVN